MEEIELRHPFWLKLLGWLVAPLMLVVSVWVMLIPVIFNRYELIVIVSFASLGGFTLYMTNHTLKTLPFMNAVITVSDNGITVAGIKKVTNLDWKSISKIKHITSAQVLHLYDSQGQRFLSVSEKLRGFSVLVDYLNKKNRANIWYT